MNIRSVLGFVVFALITSFSQNSWAAIGRIAFVSGDATIERTVRGQAVILKAEKNVELMQGDTLQTGPRSRLQWKMADDAIVAINSNSAFVIREYSAPTANADGRAFYSLLKGGLRMLSGLIGKKNQDSFSLTTPTATMGIRGTIFEVYVVTVDGITQTIFKTDAGLISINSNGVARTLSASEEAVVTQADKSPVTATPEQLAAIAALGITTEIDSSTYNTIVNPTDDAKDGSEDGSKESDTDENTLDDSKDSPASETEGQGSEPHVGENNSAS